MSGLSFPTFFFFFCKFRYISTFKPPAPVLCVCQNTYTVLTSRPFTVKESKAPALCGPGHVPLNHSVPCNVERATPAVWTKSKDKGSLMIKESSGRSAGDESKKPGPGYNGHIFQSDSR